ncbi:MAG: fibronectin type III domain-containing protein [Prevotella sp.]
MKKELYRIFLMMTAIVLGLASCSDDDEIAKTPLSPTSISEGAKTVSTLAFSWTPVADATQYAYELKDEAGEVVLGGTTNTTSVLATGLKVHTTYTLNVWAYAALSGDKTTSPIATLTATTNEVAQLGTPQAVAVENNGIINVVWPAVDNAEYYYVYVDVEESQVGNTDLATITTTTSIALSGLAVGDHTVYVFAMTDDENYSLSEGFKLSFIKAKNELWRTEANYYCEALNQDFATQVVAYEDGSYAIEGIYGSDERIEFYVDTESVIDGIPEIVFTNAYKVNAPYYYFHAGDYTFCIYYQRGTGYCGWENGNRTKGEVWFYTYLYDKDDNYLGGGFDDITWGTDEATLTVDDLVGEYTEVTNCWDMTYDWANWTEVTNQESDVAISKVDDTTISIYNFYGWEDNFTAKVDLASRIITVDIKSDWGGYYTFCQYDDPDTPVVGTINDDGTITFSNWTIYYADYQYSYVYSGATSVLTKK